MGCDSSYSGRPRTDGGGKTVEADRGRKEMKKEGKTSTEEEKKKYKGREGRKKRRAEALERPLGSRLSNKRWWGLSRVLLDSTRLDWCRLKGSRTSTEYFGLCRQSTES